jgi:hypothetical protein
MVWMEKKSSVLALGFSQKISSNADLLFLLFTRHEIWLEHIRKLAQNAFNWTAMATIMAAISILAMQSCGAQEIQTIVLRSTIGVQIQDKRG